MTKQSLLISLTACAVLIVGAVRAEDAKPEDAKPAAVPATTAADAPKPSDVTKAPESKPADPVKPADPAKPAEAEITKSGVLGTLPPAVGITERPADVVAILQIGGGKMQGGKPGKNGKHKKNAAGAAESFNLRATGDIAEKLKTLLAKNAHVEVTGTLNGDTMLVSKVTEVEKKHKRKGA